MIYVQLFATDKYFVGPLDNMSTLHRRLTYHSSQSMTVYKVQPWGRTMIQIICQQQTLNETYIKLKSIFFFKYGKTCHRTFYALNFTMRLYITRGTKMGTLTPALSKNLVSYSTSQKMFAFLAAGANRRLPPEAGSACKRRLTARLSPLSMTRHLCRPTWIKGATYWHDWCWCVVTWDES